MSIHIEYENAGIQYCMVCGLEKECYYLIAYPDIGDYCMCDDCIETSEEYAEQYQVISEKRLVEIIEEFNYLHEGIELKREKWLGFRGALTLNKYNKLESRLIKLGYLKDDKGYFILPY